MCILFFILYSSRETYRISDPLFCNLIVVLITIVFLRVYIIIHHVYKYTKYNIRVYKYVHIFCYNYNYNSR